MKDAVEYLHHIKALILGNSAVLKIEIVREEAFEDVGLFRFRLKLTDTSLLEIFERFSVQEGDVQVLKYSFHWQDTGGQLRARWDNASHHPEIPTHPYHLHEGDNANTMPSEPMNTEKVLSIVGEKLNT